MGAQRNQGSRGNRGRGGKPDQGHQRRHGGKKGKGRNRGQGSKQAQGRHENRGSGRNQPDKTSADGGFLNPYNFVATPDRPTSGVAGDHRPVGHARWVTGTWTGEIPIRIRTRTPLLLPAQDIAGPGEHARLVRTRTQPGTNGHPHMLATSLKGTLRAALEAITNSRYGVMDRQGLSVARGERERNTRETRHIARVERENDGAYQVTYVKSLFGLKRESAAPKISIDRLRDVNKFAEESGNPIGDDCLLFFIKEKRGRQSSFIVTKVLRGDTDPAVIANSRSGGECLIKGYVLRSGYREGAKMKKFERVFPVAWWDQGLNSSSETPGGWSRSKLITGKISRSPELVAKWRRIMESYEAVEDERERKSDEVVVGRHCDAGDSIWQNFGEGTIFWLRGNTDKVKDLVPVPVMFGRRPFEFAPLDLIRDGHVPARSFDEFSPMERLFGWVSQEGSDLANSSYRGHISVGPIEVDAGDDAIVHFDRDKRIPLAALAQPKPQQWQFYVDGVDGYNSKNSRLRGRKFYRSHGLVVDGKPGAGKYWQPENSRKGPGDRDREYRAPDGQSCNVGSEISGWVRPGIEFTTTLRFSNVGSFELAALLWLLDSPEEFEPKVPERLFTMGLGKPLGFGAVTIGLDGAPTLRSGEEMIDRARHLRPEEVTATENEDRKTELIAGYLAAVQKDASLRTVQEQFLALTSPDESFPVHYPRQTSQLAKPEDALKWWSKTRSVLPPADREGPDFTYGGGSHQGSSGGGSRRSGGRRRPPGDRRRR